jgi:hypothetical protein
MSILGAMFTAVSGLNAQSRSLGNISDNIANSQTVGYKKVDTRFSDIITISNKSLNLPGGVIASPYYANALQGNINQTQSWRLRSQSRRFRRQRRRLLPERLVGRPGYRHSGYRQPCADPGHPAHHAADADLANRSGRQSAGDLDRQSRSPAGPDQRAHL